MHSLPSISSKILSEIGNFLLLILIVGIALWFMRLLVAYPLAIFGGLYGLPLAFAVCYAMSKRFARPKKARVRSA